MKRIKGFLPSYQVGVGKVLKKERKAETLLRSVAEKTGLSQDEIYEKAGALMEKEYGLYEGFEKVVKEGTIDAVFPHLQRKALMGHLFKSQF